MLRLPAAALLALATLGAASATAAPEQRVRATFVGDSVAASITYVPTARAQLSRGLTVALDLEVCRRLVQPSCWHDGSAPSTALQAVRERGRTIGDVLIVDVGYNDPSSGYGAGVDRIMRSALRQGAKGVVWVTLRETSANYHSTNVAIARAARRWPRLVVADWNAHSHGRPWFVGDGLHLTAAGASALARFLRPYVVEAARG